jgi:hypothetical protein
MAASTSGGSGIFFDTAANDANDRYVGEPGGLGNLAGAGPLAPHLDDQVVAAGQGLTDLPSGAGKLLREWAG